ncbi:MAG: NADH-quinone oxidoreductase subunit N [Candidatus Omnitrophica bacterium]|nr:NADH-quinone oxidoreductase subunit N [Candidatus Omnitrophota bacterium]
MSGVLLDSLAAWWPEVILSAGALVVLLTAVWSKRGQIPLILSWVTLGASAWALTQTGVSSNAPFFGLIVCDGFSLLFRWIALGSIAITLLMIMASQEVRASMRGEYLAILLLMGVGLMLMVEANHLLMAYLSIEFVSLSGYLLVGFPDNARAAEGALKYFLFGALASAVMLFGMSLLYGMTDALLFPELLQKIQPAAAAFPQGVLLAVILLLVGLAFKISMVPFHLWTPDAYEAAPMPVAALLSVAPKAAAFGLLIRFLSTLAPLWQDLYPLFLSLTILTMTLGNLVALTQTNIKRLLAYSTIAQAGYLLIGITAGTPIGVQALVLYLIAYLFMNFGAFACAVAVVEQTGSESLDAFRGLSTRAPVLAFACVLFLLSLAGIPPLFGFMGKFFLFGAALQAGQTLVAVAAVINSAIALYYYVNIMRLMFLQSAGEAQALQPVPALHLALGVCALATLFFGLFPSSVLSWLGPIRLVL